MTALLNSFRSFGSGGGGGSPPLGDPLDISGCVLWLDPTTINAEYGTDVSAWADSSGNGNAATSEIGPQYHDGRYTSHGKPGLLFQTPSRKMTVAANASLDNSNITYVSIVQLKGLSVSSGNCHLFNKKNTNAGTVSCLVTSADFQAFVRCDGTEGTVRGMSNTSCIDQSLRMHVVRCNGTIARYEIAYDGTLELVQQISVPAVIDTDSSNTLTIGNHPDADSDFNSHFLQYDFLVYNNHISDSDLQRLADWAAARYPVQFAKNSAMFSSGPLGVSVVVDGSTAYLTYVKSDGVTIAYKTAPVSDPHNWTDQGNIFTAAAACRACCLRKYSGTWYLYYDTRSTGTIRVATGASLGALSDYGGNPILSGSGSGDEQFVRFPFVLTPAETHDAGWHMLYDGRNGSSTSGVGSGFHATSSDGLTWTRDTTHNPIIPKETGEAFDANSITSPSAIYIDGAYRVFWSGFYQDILTADYPHHIGEGASTDLTSVTRVRRHNTVLPLAQDGAAFDIVLHQSPAPYDPGDGNFYLYFIGAQTGAVPTTQIGYGRETPVPLRLEGTPVLTAYEERAYTWTVTAVGGKPGYTYALVDAWPSGISINSSTGVISGSPANGSAGSYPSLSVRVTDALGNTASVDSFTLTVTATTIDGLLLGADNLKLGADELVLSH